MLRKLWLSAGLLPLALALACTAAVQANTIVRLHAEHVEFYYDRFLIEADGNVRIQTSDGFTVTGDAFSMDLKLNRFLVAGHVTLRTKGDQVSGAAISDFLDFNRIYFVPITSEPDRWTFLNGNLTHPVKGRIMPGDVFYFPNITQKPSLTASSAVIGTRTFVHFSGATTYLGGLPVPLGNFVVNFATSQYFAQNSLSGANYDVTWNFAGSNNSLSALHVRYDQTNFGPYLSFEQHLVGQHEYAVFSLNPGTKVQKFWDLQLYDKLGDNFQIQTFSQLYTNQHVLEEPLSSALANYITAVQALPHSYLTAYSILTNYSLLGERPDTEQYGQYVGAGDHPSSLQLTWTSFNNRIWGSPLYEQIYAGYGFNHDSVGQSYFGQPGIPPGLQCYGGNVYQHCFGGTVFTTIYNTLLGYTLSLPSLKFGNLDAAYASYQFNASVSAQRQWYTVPHHVNTTTMNSSVSRQFSKPLGAYVSYQIANTSDLYQYGGYPSYIPPAGCPTCPIDYGYAAFQGASTLRTLNLGINFMPNPDFNFTLLARKHDDFPVPFPGAFPTPPPTVIGLPSTLSYLGQPPYDITPDIRFRLMPHMLIDVQRTYYFNFGNERWSPSFIVQVFPQ